MYFSLLQFFEFEVLYAQDFKEFNNMGVYIKKTNRAHPTLMPFSRDYYFQLPLWKNYFKKLLRMFKKTTTISCFQKQLDNKTLSYFDSPP